jgi:hypothetical protein
VEDRWKSGPDYYAASLEPIPDGEAEDGGVAVGNAAAAPMIAERTGDGRFGDPSFSEGTGAGEWPALAPGLAGNNFRWVGEVDPFLVPDASQFATNGPLPLASAACAAEFDQVKTLGRRTGSTRTPDQTEQALFWVARGARTESSRWRWPSRRRAERAPMLGG